MATSCPGWTERGLGSKGSSPGWLPGYLGTAIRLVPTLRLVVHLGLRPGKTFTARILRLPVLARSVPGHSTLRRHGWAFAGWRPIGLASLGLSHLLLTSTNPGLFGRSK